MKRLAAFALAVTAAAGIAQAPPQSAAIRMLTEPQDDYPDVSPDGERIVFQSNRSGTWQLWIMNRDGSGLRRLTHNHANDRTPAWSPDGTRILFSSDRAGAANIHVLDLGRGLDGADARAVRLLTHTGQDIHPKWTRDGRAIIFNRVNPGNDGAVVMVAGADGGAPRPVDLGPGWNTYASLTPDGARLVYRGTMRELREGREVENSDIYAAAPDGSDRVRLTDDPAFDGWPSLSPDGRTIAFASRRAGARFHIFLIPVTGGAARQITFGDVAHYTQPAWSPDGGSLLAYRWTQEGRGESGSIVSIDLSANDAVR